MERSSGSKEDTNTIAEKVSQKIKTRTGVKPKEVIVLDEGTIPRATHKAKRVVDLRAASNPQINLAR
ncbi:MAG: acyl-CoA synthetase family protein [Methanothrix sp.]